MNEVCRQLTIASIDEVQDNLTGDYDAILSVCQDTCDANVSDSVVRDFAERRHDETVRGANSKSGEYSFQMFNDAVKQLVQALFDDKEVLIHCHVTRNRSVSISMAALAVYRDWTFSQSYRVVMEGQDKKPPDDELLAFARHAIASAPRGYPQ